jgi:hypothetical protein
LAHDPDGRRIEALAVQDPEQASFGQDFGLGLGRLPPTSLLIDRIHKGGFMLWGCDERDLHVAGSLFTIGAQGAGERAFAGIEEKKPIQGIRFGDGGFRGCGRVVEQG